MNEELTNLIVKWVDKLGGGVEQGIEFAIQEAPEIFKQYLYIQSVDAIMGILLCSVFFVVGIALILLGIFKKMDDDGFGKLICFLIGVTTIITSSWIAFHNAGNYLKITNAPKAYMMIKVSDYIACKNEHGTRNGNCHL
jgi:hypothetical protein